MAHDFISEITTEHIEDLQLAASDPKNGAVFSLAYFSDLMNWEEFNEATALDWCDDSYHECKQMMACFILLSLDIELEV
jgi:hypothetical protein